MGKRTAAKQKPIVDTAEQLGPTSAQRDRAQFIEVEAQEKQAGGVALKLGRVWKRRPMIDILAAQHVFSDAETKALWHYRHHADIADRSPLLDSLGKLVRVGGGSGHGPTVEVLNAVAVVRACERAAGSLAPILRAVVVDDQSLSQWAMDHGGSMEVRRGKKFELQPFKLHLKRARVEIQMAAKRVMAELDA